MLSIGNYSLNTSLISSFLADDIIEPTYKTPFVRYNSRFNQLTIKGASTRKEIGKFYRNVLGEFKMNLKRKKCASLDLHFKTFNISTTKVLFDLFRFLKQQQTQGATIQINWNVSQAENLDIRKTASDFAELFELDIDIN